MEKRRIHKLLEAEVITLLTVSVASAGTARASSTTKLDYGHHHDDSKALES